MTHNRTVFVLWLALIASLAASWTHLTALFARHEYPGWWPVGATMATAVDLGILAAMMAVGEMAAAGRSTSGPRRTVALLVAMSCAANAAHVWVVGVTGDLAEMALAVAVAAALPVLVWRLSLILDAIRRPVPASVAVLPATPAPGPVVRPAAKPRQAPVPAVTGDARARVLAVLATGPLDVSARELGRQAETTGDLVRRMAGAGVIEKNGTGWQVAP